MRRKDDTSLKNPQSSRSENGTPQPLAPLPQKVQARASKVLSLINSPRPEQRHHQLPSLFFKKENNNGWVTTTPAPLLSPLPINEYASSELEVELREDGFIPVSSRSPVPDAESEFYDPNREVSSSNSGRTTNSLKTISRSISSLEVGLFSPAPGLNYEITKANLKARQKRYAITPESENDALRHSQSLPNFAAASNNKEGKLNPDLQVESLDDDFSFENDMIRP